MPSKCHAPPSSLQFSGHLCSDPVTLANAFNYYFANIGPMLNKTTDSFMDRSVGEQSAMLGNSMSSFKQVTCWVPQGSILGPLLFSIYVRDLPRQADHYDISQFADDTVHVASRSILEIQHQLNTDLIQTARWLKSKKLHVNGIIILFGSRHALSRNPVLNIFLQGENLQQANT